MKIFQFCCCLALVLFFCYSEPVYADGLLAGDPMVRVTAPPAMDVDVDLVLTQLSADVSEDSGLDPSLLTYYWQRFEAIHCMGKKAESFPLFVDLYVPGFLTTPEVGVIMHSIADSLAKSTGIDKKWIFIHTHTAEDKRVLLSGEIALAMKEKSE